MSRPRGWTDQQLVDAVEAAGTLCEVLERLGLSKGGASLATVRRRMLALGLDEPSLLRAARSPAWAADPHDGVAHAGVRPRWTPDELRMAVLASTSMRAVLRRLGYPASGAAWSVAKAQILQLALDTSHFGRDARRRAARSRPDKPATDRRTWSDEQLVEAVAASTSLMAVLRRLGLQASGSTYPVLRERIAALGLDTSHFKSKGWNKGLKVTTRPARPLAEVLVENSHCHSTHDLRLRLIKEGVKRPVCEGCGGTTWRGLPMPLQLDHINGRRHDNRLPNLRILCPNCHAQTETWCGRNIGKTQREGTLSASAPVVESWRDTTDSSPVAERREGSNPSRGTRQLDFGELLGLG